MAIDLNTFNVATAPASVVIKAALLQIEWEAALAVHICAAARCAALEGLGASDAMLDAAIDADDGAFDALMQTPAPDYLAVMRKLEIAVARECDIDEIVPAIADLRRLGAN